MITAGDRLKVIDKLEELKEKRFNLIVEMKEIDIRLAGMNKKTRSIDFKDRSWWVKHRQEIELQIIKMKREIQLFEDKKNELKRM